MVSRVVLDASVTVAWLLDEEGRGSAHAALTRLATEVALVPRHWHLEVRSALLGAERRRRIRADEVDERLHALAELSVRTDTEPQVTTAFALARRHGLSIYDAVCLEPAQRSDAPLATLDQAMSRAAAATGLAPVEP